MMDSIHDRMHDCKFATENGNAWVIHLSVHHAVMPPRMSSAAPRVHSWVPALLPTRKAGAPEVHRPMCVDVHSGSVDFTAAAATCADMAYTYIDHTRGTPSTRHQSPRAPITPSKHQVLAPEPLPMPTTYIITAFHSLTHA